MVLDRIEGCVSVCVCRCVCVGGLMLRLPVANTSIPYSCILFLLLCAFSHALLCCLPLFVLCLFKICLINMSIITGGGRGKLEWVMGAGMCKDALPFCRIFCSNFLFV